jgi:abortive infection bacteriophage resistance protein
MAKVPYSKGALNYADQLQKLKSRGLMIDNDEKTLHLLEQVSYYRLSGYWYPLLEEPKSDHKLSHGCYPSKSSG